MYTVDKGLNTKFANWPSEVFWSCHFVMLLAAGHNRNMFDTFYLLIMHPRKLLYMCISYKAIQVSKQG